MVREDIIAGLKNAIERGYSLELAKQSFISAGYPLAEVEAAVNSIKSGYVITEESAQPMQTYEPPESHPTPQPLQTRQLSPVQPTAQPAIRQQMIRPKANFSFFSRLKGSWKITLLVSLLAVLVVIFILTIIFREEIVTWLTP